MIETGTRPSNKEMIKEASLQQMKNGVRIICTSRAGIIDEETPHIGAQIEEAQICSTVEVAGEVIAALNGDALRWEVF